MNGQVDRRINSLSLVKYLNKDLCLGKDYRDGDSYFTGVMRFISIYGAALSDSDIATLSVFPSQAPSNPTIPPTRAPSSRS